MNDTHESPYASPSSPAARVTVAWRALAAIMAIVAMHIVLAVAIVKHFLSDSSIIYGDLELAYSMLALLPIVDMSTFLLFAMRTPIRDFFTLSVFTVPSESLVQVRLTNIIAVASTASLAWIVGVSFLCPTATAVFVECVSEPFGQIVEGLQLDHASLFVMSAAVVWLTLFTGAVWVLLVSPCVILFLKYCLAIHVALPNSHSFTPNSSFKVVGDPLAQTASA